MPVLVVIVADIFVLLGYGLVFLVFRENSYASRIIEVEQNQKVISSSQYAMIRHPMYLGVSLMCIFSLLALESYWEMIPALGIILLLVERICDEERVLLRVIKGYPDTYKRLKIDKSLAFGSSFCCPTFSFQYTFPNVTEICDRSPR